MLSSGYHTPNRSTVRILPSILLFRPEHQSGAIVFTQMKNVLSNAKRNSFLILQPAQSKSSDERLRAIGKKHHQLTERANLIAAMPYIQPNPLCEKQEKLHTPFNLYGIYNGSTADLFGMNLIPTYEKNGILYPKPCAIMLDMRANILAMIELASEHCEDDVSRLVAMAESCEAPIEERRYA